MPAEPRKAVKRAPAKKAAAKKAPAKKAVPPEQPPAKVTPRKDARAVSKIQSGFTSIREIASYVLGAGVLIYGVAGASSDKALVVVGAGLALLGAPIVGTLFDSNANKKARDDDDE